MITFHRRVALQGGNSIAGHMSVMKDTNDPDTDHYNTTKLPEGGWYGIGLDDRYAANRFHLATPEMRFHGFVTGTGTPDINEWEVGFVQNIYYSTRGGVYEQNVRRTMRQSPAHLPVRDGDEGACLWYDSSEGQHTKLKVNQDVQISTNDAPNYDLPVMYDGQATSPDPFRVGNLRLLGTEGKEQFKTFLVAAHERDKSLIILAAVEWTIEWTGTLVNGTWTPVSPTMVTVRDVSSYVSPNPIFLNLRGNPGAHLPFSPDEACGFETFEIQTGPATWQSCSSGSGKPKRMNPGTDRWVDRPAT